MQYGGTRRAFAEGESDVAGLTAIWYIFNMTTAQDIEEAVVHMPAAELGKFRAWFVSFDAQAWDREFEDDARSGKLDRLADQALDDLARGRCSEL